MLIRWLRLREKKKQITCQLDASGFVELHGDSQISETHEPAKTFTYFNEKEIGAAYTI